MRPLSRPAWRLSAAACALAASALATSIATVPASATGGGAPAPWQRVLAKRAIVTYDSPAALRAALRRSGASLVREIPSLGVAEVLPAGTPAAFAAETEDLPGVEYLGSVARRVSTAEPAVAPSSSPGGAFQWQWAATRSNLVPASVQRAASQITIAVVDTGADVGAPDLAAKSPDTYNAITGTQDVSDHNGHGTFVSSLAAGSVSNGDGIAGFGGDAKLLVIRAGRADGSFTDIDEATAIVYAVDHGAKIINLSLGGTEPSTVERKAIEYAAASGALVIAAAGNEYEQGNPVEYPAATLQPPGSRGEGGLGLSVAATTLAGTRASFSNTGSHISLAAPGDEVFSALSSTSSPSLYPRTALPGASRGLYGYSSGTSFSAPQVTGAAALVWAAKPSLTGLQVAEILKRTASGRGVWTPQLGYGVIDVAAAVTTALGGNPDALPATSAPTILHVGVRKVRVKGKVVRMRVSARLGSAIPAISTARRLVVLESFRNGHWRNLGRARTLATGKVGWNVGFRRGYTYRLRVRYLGAPDLQAARKAVRFRIHGPAAPRTAHHGSH